MTIQIVTSDTPLPSASGYWIQTHSGKRFDFSAPAPSAISLEDIAHALSHTCRYGGHCEPFYSVAEHSIHVMRRVTQRATELGFTPGFVRDLARAALMHDAAEAYIGDFPSPLKAFLGANVRRLERLIMAAVTVRFSLSPAARRHPLIKTADLEVLMSEAPQLLTPMPDADWSAGIHVGRWPDFRRWSWWGRLWTKRRFLRAARELGVE